MSHLRPFSGVPAKAGQMVCSRLIVATVMLVVASFTQAMPNWVSQPRQDSQQYWYATGSGRDLDAARANALASLAGRFNSTVQQQYVSSERFADNTLDVTAEVTTAIETGTQDFSNYRFTRVEEGTEVWTEIELDLAAFAAAVDTRFRQDDKVITNAMDAVRNAGRVSTVTRIGELQQQVSGAIARINQLEVLGRPATAGDTDRYFGYLSELQQTESSARLLVHVDESSRVLLAPMQETLSRHGIASQQVPTSSEADVVIQTRITDLDSERASEVELATEVTIQEADTTLAAHQFKLRGRSYDGRDAAIARSGSRFTALLKRMTLDELLGAED